MPYEVRSTPLATAQINGIRGAARKAVDAFLTDLSVRGCTALDYRLTGEVLDKLCVRHLRGAMRAVVAFPTDAPDTVWIVLIGEHTRDQNNIYDQLYALVGITPPEGPRTKPACCGEEGDPPDADTALIDSLTRRVRALR